MNPVPRFAIGWMGELAITPGIHSLDSGLSIASSAVSETHTKRSRPSRQSCLHVEQALSFGCARSSRAGHQLGCACSLTL